MYVGRSRSQLEYCCSKRLNRKEQGGRKIPNIYLDSCTLKNSAVDQRSSVAIFWGRGKERRT